MTMSPEQKAARIAELKALRAKAAAPAETPAAATPATIASDPKAARIAQIRANIGGRQ